MTSLADKIDAHELSGQLKTSRNRIGTGHFVWLSEGRRGWIQSGHLHLGFSPSRHKERSKWGWGLNARGKTRWNGLAMKNSENVQNHPRSPVVDSGALKIARRSFRRRLNHPDHPSYSSGIKTIPGAFGERGKCRIARHLCCCSQIPMPFAVFFTPGSHNYRAE